MSPILHVFRAISPFQALLTIVTVPLWHQSEPSDTSEPSNISESSDDDTEWDRLSDKTILKFLAWVDFENLQNVAEQNERFRQLIEQHLIRDRFQLHERTICIANELNSIDSSEKCFLINDHQLALKFLKNFGHVVIALKLNGHNFTQGQIEEIGHHIDEHCSNSLRDLTLEQIDENPIVSWTNQFPKLKAATFRDTKKHQAKNLKIHEIFPNIQQLEIECDGNSSFDFIGYNFPHLECLKLMVPVLPDNTHLNRVLSLNPQLRSFHMNGYFDVKLLDFISKNLPNLRDFGVKYNLFGDSRAKNMVHFDDVTDFSLDMSNMPFGIGYNLHLFTFKHLKSIELICRDFNLDLIKFVKANDGLTTVKIFGTNPNYATLVGLIRDLPELKHIHAQWNSSKESCSVVELMYNINPIESITLALSEDKWDALMKTIPKKWRLVNDLCARHQHYLTFARDTSELLDEIYRFRSFVAFSMFLAFFGVFGLFPNFCCLAFSAQSPSQDQYFPKNSTSQMKPMEPSKDPSQMSTPALQAYPTQIRNTLQLKRNHSEMLRKISENRKFQ